MPFDGIGFVETPRRVRPTTTRAWISRLRALVAPAPDVPFVVEGPSTEDPVVAFLLSAKRMIETPETWTRGAYSTPGGKYCSVGALRAAGARFRDPVAQCRAHTHLQEIAFRRGFCSIEVMNDRSSHAEVMTAFDEAIAAARRRTAGSA